MTTISHACAWSASSGLVGPRVGYGPAEGLRVGGAGDFGPSFRSGDT